jgi:acetyl-CoA synthetase
MEAWIGWNLAKRANWRCGRAGPRMFRSYLDDEERYRLLRRRLVSERRSGRSDADGYFWFLGRSDDVIKTAGHLIGPFEVESVLLEHPAVAEAGHDRQAR